MEKKNIKKTIFVFGIVAVVVLLAWFIVIYPLIDFSKKEKMVLNASKEYYSKNSALLPQDGDMSTVTLRTLLKQKYVSTIKSTYGSKYCNVDDSWVKVKRKNGEYNYYVYLECGSMKSTVDHEGPTIKLKGDEEITLEKGSKFEDPGIDNVYDDTDGKMNTKDVTVSGKVNTNKIGTYTIKYTSVDSFNNKNTVERVVKIIQTLDKLVESDTDKSNIYKGVNVNNYIEFSNMLFRIVGINSDGSIKIVSAEPVGTVNYDDINTWLNDYFYEHLTDKAKKYMVKQKFCSSKVETKNASTVKNGCTKSEKQYVGLLAISDYNNSVKDGNSYLYPNTMAWTSDYAVEDDGAWTVRNFYIGYGNNVKNLEFNKKYNFAVYPVVNLESGIVLNGGDGTDGNPYTFSKVKKGKVGEKINTRYSGEYVYYNDNLFRIIEVVDGNTKVVSANNINQNLTIGYTTQSVQKIYNPTEKGNIGYFIENSLTKYLKNDIFVKKEIEVPIYKNLATYSGKKDVKKYKVKLSAPNMYELYSGVSTTDVQSYWLINSSKTENRKYLVSNNNVIYYNEMSDFTVTGVRVRGYLDKNVTILSGNGTKNSPYVLVK